MTEYREIKELPGYRFGNDGSVWSSWNNKGRIGTDTRLKWKHIKGSLNDKNYIVIKLCVDRQKKDFKIARLILQAFVGPCPLGHEACHNNGVRSDNRLENLRWDTKKANEADKQIHGTFISPRGEKNGRSKLTNAQVVQIFALSSCGFSLSKIGRQFNVHPETIGKILRKQSWKHLREEDVTYV